ncbi:MULTISPECIES: hypothetical protein [Acinetobacter]|uniref:Uncharacterized protein n=1 Tax=Acinetobacter higginsii TaxID=70347 RepID=N9RLD9_9GAMM|nr:MULTISPECIES: hypothetical protein [Acinetobacter]ENX58769.1 hypothetical protein F902_01396 [Acinetobacter higginsii]
MKFYLIWCTYVCFVLSLSVIRFQAKEFKAKHGIEGWLSYYFACLSGSLEHQMAG